MTELILRPYQTEAVGMLRASLKEGRKRLMLSSPTGCHARDTLVLLADGSAKAVQDVVVGDKLLGPYGEARNVMSVTSGVDRMYRVTPKKGDPYVVNSGHILSLRKTPGSDGMALADGTRVARDADVVNINVEIFARSNATVRRCLKGWRSDAVEFHRAQEELLLDPYWLGCWLGDGNSNGPSITKGACRMIEAWKRSAELMGHGVTEYAEKSRCSTWNIVGSNGVNRFRTALKFYGLIGDKHVPDPYKFASVGSRLRLIAGMIDSDGHLSSGGFDWISARRRLAEDFAYLCRSVGLAAYITPCKKCIASTGFVGDYWRVSVSGDTNRVPCLDKIASERKQKKRHLVHGVRVESAGEGEYFGFSVDGDHLYLLADFTATHNSGKTEIGMEVIRGAVRKGKRVTFLCNRIHLVEQTSRRLQAAGIQHGVIQGENSRAEYLPVIVASIQTVAKRGMPQCDLIVIDEAHGVAGSSEFRAVVMQRKDVPVIGLSATPWSKGLAKVYPDLGGPLFEELVTAVTIPDLIEHGYLVDADVYAPSEPDLTDVKLVVGDYHEGQLGDACDKPGLIGDIVQHWQKLAGGQPTVCFATNIAHSKHIVEQFRGVGVTAEHLDCYTKDEERRDILARVAAGQTTVISNVGILCEGWDFPACRVLILARPTRSMIRYIQMAGRVLRPSAGKERALILDHSGTCKRLGFPTDHHDLPLDDGKPKKAGRDGDKDEPMPKACPSCHFMRPAKVHKCPACGFMPERQSEVEVQAGELALMKRRGKPENDLAKRFGSKQQVWSMLGTAQSAGGYSDGWRAHKYRTIFDVWPKGLHDVQEPLSAELRSWLRAEQIRWAKSRTKNQGSQA